MNKKKKSTASADWPSSILVVEDDSNILKFMGELLTSLGISPTLAGDGREAIEELQLDSFPLVFTDMNMPHIDGLQLIVHIRDHYPGTDVIAMTGYSQDYDLVDVIRAGAADYMTKPFTLDELKAKIRRVTRERALFQLLQQEIAKRRHSESDLSQQNNTLLEQVQQQKDELLEANAALRIILRQRDMEKNELTSSLTTRFFKEIVPYLEKLKQTPLQEAQKRYLNIATMNLENIFIPASQNRRFNHTPFTKTEAKVINLMKQQKKSKEIADFLQVSTGTIRTHRENIRKKLQITNTKKSLYKTLLSIP
jgi:DNA-binding response OmpR family regulator/DNA-binding CsgD family transcriptional regulator